MIMSFVWGEDMSERALKPGTIINERYEIKRVIGEGGFGITYLAHDMENESDVALKEYFPIQSAFRDSQTGEVKNSNDEKEREESDFDRGRKYFLKEAAILQEYRHLEGIVRVWDCFLDNNTAYIVMEYIDGITMKQYLSIHGGFGYDELMELLSPVMKSLATLHRHGVIHRDISPDNLMIGIDNHIYLIDFGSAKEVVPGKTTTVLLKSGFSPPEQYLHDGKLGAWTDVYGLCATIYNALSGKVPVDAVARLQGKELVPIYEYCSSIEDWQWHCIEKGMRIRYAERYRNVEELLDALSVPPTEEDMVTVYGDTDTENVVGKVMGNSTDDSAVWMRRRRYIAASLIIVLGVALYGIISMDKNYGDKSVEYGTVSEESSEADESEVGKDDNTVINGVENSNAETGNNTSVSVSSDSTSDDDAILCKMPNVVGMSNSDAYKAIREADDKISIKTERSYSNDVDSGIVMAQNVEASTVYNEGAIAEIIITVSLGKEQSTGSAAQSGSYRKKTEQSSKTESSYDVKSDGNESEDFYLDD